MQLNQLTHLTTSTVEIVDIFDDSRSVSQGGLFVAVSGAKFDGVKFIQSAIDNGAVAVAYDQTKVVDLPDHLVGIPVDDPRIFLKEVTLKFYGPLSDKLNVIGVTGTNGKTTTTYLIETLLSCAGQTCGVIGTINHRINDEVIESKNTTPGFLDNQKFLKQLVDQNADACVMEVSSHALDQNRVEGINFRGAVFTNLSGDHLDYHKTMEDYFAAKSKLFAHIAPDGWAAINVDDVYGQQLQVKVPCNTITYGLNNKADLTAHVLHTDLNGMEIMLTCVHGQIEFHTTLIGQHNAYNLLATAAVGLAQEMTLDEIKLGLDVETVIPGRLERVDYGQDFYVFIDYAHTHDGLENVLNALVPLKENKLITVFGCGGDRDTTKRLKMGAVASALSDIVFVTSDNPRSEEPQKIIDDILVGIAGDDHQVVVDRRDAIAQALKQAQTGDIILIAGKGHEDYQILKNETISFDERKIIKEILKDIRC